MKTILFVMLPAPSHYNASFCLAKFLQKCHSKIIFTGVEQQKNLIEQENFIFEYLRYETKYKTRFARTFVGLFLKNLLDKNDIRQRFRLFYQPINEISNLMRRCNPSVIFVDEHLYHYYIYLKKWNIPIFILNTKLSTKKAKNVPPLDSDFIPSDTFISNLFVKILWHWHIFKIEKSTYFEKFALLGKDEFYFQKRYCRIQNINWEQIINTKNGLYIGLKNVPTIILAPKQLEFSKRKDLANEFYINLKIEKNESKHITEEYKALIEKIQSLQDTKVIYCAFGTLPTTAYQRIIIFLDKLLRIISQESNLLLVVSTSGVEMDLPTYPNVHLFSFLPQLDMLKHCDLMITHGGLGSVKECLQAGVQILVYPLNLKIDQRGNAARVVANGFGLRGDMEKDSEAEILRKIKLLLTQPFRKCREVDSEEKVMELLRDLRIEVSTHLLTQ